MQYPSRNSDVIVAMYFKKSSQVVVSVSSPKLLLSPKYFQTSPKLLFTAMRWR